MNRQNQPCIKYHCCILYKGDIGEGFAKELDKRVKERNGDWVKNWLNWKTFVGDKYDMFHTKAKEANYLVFVITKDCVKDGNYDYWFKNCQEIVNTSSSANKKVSIVIVGGVSLEDLPDTFKIYNPEKFDINYRAESTKWDNLLEEIKVVRELPFSSGQHSYEKSISQKWRDFLGDQFETMCKGIDPINITDALVASHILTTDENEEIDQEHRTRKKRVQAILNKVMDCDEEVMKRFLRVIERKEQYVYAAIEKAMPDELAADLIRKKTPQTTSKPVVRQSRFESAQGARQSVFESVGEPPVPYPVQAVDVSLSHNPSSTVERTASIPNEARAPAAAGGNIQQNINNVDHSDGEDIADVATCMDRLEITRGATAKCRKRAIEDVPKLRFCVECGEKYAIAEPKFCNACGTAVPRITIT